MKTRWLFLFLCLGALAVFLYGVIGIFQLRFARGDVYPPYSSLRTDPLGAKIFFESLRRAGAEVARNQIPLDQFQPRGRITLFLAGSDLDEWPEPDLKSLEEFTKSGGRLVIAFFPQRASSVQRNRNVSPAPSSTPRDEDFKVLLETEFAKRWGLSFKRERVLIGGTAKSERLPEEIPWHSALYFDRARNDWQTIYAVGERPVIIERKMGRGTIVLASDSYFLSNEAMVEQRHPTLLSWLAGASDQFIFDETHLGVMEEPGVATLIRRHGLGGLFLGLALVAALVCWKNSARLVPAPSNVSSEIAVSGKQSFDGLINLLRRNIPRRDLLAVCLREWKSSASRRQQEKIARAETLFTEQKEGSDLVGRYCALTEITNEKWTRKT